MNRMPRLEGRRAGSVELIGGRLCLDFINSVGARRWSGGEMSIRDEKLHDYLDLLAWAAHAGALTQSEAEGLARESHHRQKEAEAVFRRAIQLREGVYQIFRALLLHKRPKSEDLALLNQELQQARASENLKPAHGGFGFQSEAPASELQKVLWPIALSAADLLTQGDLSRLHQCEGDDCGWLFEDITRNRSRHWCNTRDCGNVARVRAFRSRQRRGLRGSSSRP
jgi:predicted RNA-binding Zn ribbon-like protein